MDVTRHTQTPARKTPFSVFLALVVVIFFCALSAADSVGFVPYYIDGTTPTKSARATPPGSLPVLDMTTTVAVQPTHIVIPAIGLDLPVQNPTTRDIDTLDTLLQAGPARYVDSATLGQRGNVLIFAHSSHLPIVHNQMFRAFNNIPDLAAGDQIMLTGDDGKTYRYRVTSVRKANASEATIDLSQSAGKKLTLVTCDTLTSKSSRFIAEAEFVGIN